MLFSDNYMKCNKCDKKITKVPFTCPQCGKTYCLDCRHPTTHTCKPDKHSIAGILKRDASSSFQPYCVEDVMTVAPELYGNLDDYNDCSDCGELRNAELTEVNEFAGNIGE
jgi:hypothetical protein